MAQFKDLIVVGDMRVGGNIYGSEPMKFFYLDSRPTKSDPFIIEDHELGFYFFKPTDENKNSFFKLNAACSKYRTLPNNWFILTNNHPESDGDPVGFIEYFDLPSGRMVRIALAYSKSEASGLSLLGAYYETGIGNLQDLKTTTKTNSVAAINELYNDMFYQSGDIVEIGAASGFNFQVQNGYISSGKTQLFTTIILPKRLDNITTITANNIIIEARGTSGYINGVDKYHEYVGTDDYTVIVNKVNGNPYAITVVIKKESGYTNINNNTPIVLNGYFKFTLTTTKQ